MIKRRYTVGDIRKICQLWKEGKTIAQIAKATDRSEHSMFYCVYSKLKLSRGTTEKIDVEKIKREMGIPSTPDIVKVKQPIEQLTMEELTKDSTTTNQSEETETEKTDTTDTEPSEEDKAIAEAIKCSEDEPADTPMVVEEEHTEDSE